MAKGFCLLSFSSWKEIKKKIITIFTKYWKVESQTLKYSKIYLWDTKDIAHVHGSWISKAFKDEIKLVSFQCEWYQFKSNLILLKNLGLNCCRQLQQWRGKFRVAVNLRSREPFQESNNDLVFEKRWRTWTETNHGHPPDHKM